ncbi:MAG: spore maturation protein [Firmicutes bacterium]|nr:spore maturation protein [Bacillota bacterium]
MNAISKIIIPLFVLLIIFNGVKKKVNVYESFLVGAKEGLIMVFRITPTILAMVFAVNIFLDSNFLKETLSFLEPLFRLINIPIDILPMAILRPISGTASLAIMNDIFINFGPDSFIGRLAATLQGCTDTTIYVLALYYGSIKVVKTRYSLPVGLFADLMGIIAAFIITFIFFG